MKRFLSILICVILLCPLFSINVSAGNARVVFLRDGGKGNGSSYSKAVGTLDEAYNALDLSKDCVIVVCGDFNQTTHFSYGKPYSGSVRFTSVYDGVDYSKKFGAEYITVARRFVMWGETIFDDIDLKLTGEYFFIVANCYPITLTEKFNPIFTKKVSGNVVHSGVSILGGFQSGQDMHEYACYEDININVHGGKNICIAAFNRAFQHAYHFGTANITVGGKAQVGTIFFSSIDADNLISGNVKITVKDSAQVGHIRTGNGINLDVNSLIVTWEGGKIGNFIPTEARDVDGTIIKNTDFEFAPVLRYSNNVKKTADFEKISELFDKAVLIGSADDNFVPPQGEKPTADDTTQAAETEQSTPAETTDAFSEDIYDIPSDYVDRSDLESIIIIGASALIAVCLIVIVLLLRKK